MVLIQVQITIKELCEPFAHIETNTMAALVHLPRPFVLCFEEKFEQILLIRLRDSNAVISNFNTNPYMLIIVRNRELLYRHGDAAALFAELN